MGAIVSSTLEEFNSKFRVEELLILDSGLWRWSIRPVHSTLGAGVLSLSRFATSFADMTDDEAQDLAQTVKSVEAALRATFSPQKMNYVMLMMVDDHLHFHVLPRYAETKQFGGLEWVDSGWPGPPGMGDYSDRSEDKVLFDIRDHLKSNL
ncbi:HIT domain-containing protein [Actinomycetospora lutea]|uniref:HIT family protein n=1 Tax=Actinomycetospora lutea TaxID=663604 RepID=UPI002366E549|nr:HIT domain-containing protein [Actinomycetospora lutea]MDD7938079.1 HIT domain-containing protein [Actinomycetospora lutea]